MVTGLMEHNNRCYQYDQTVQDYIINLMPMEY